MLVDDEPQDPMIADLEEMTCDDMINDPTWYPDIDIDPEEPEISGRHAREYHDAKW